MSKHPPQAPRGRGALSNPDNRYSAFSYELEDDGWGGLDAPAPSLRTTLTPDASRTVIAYNKSPDVGFDRSINPYRGCEHGCIYCFARPSHAWLGLSPGLDFESRLFYKPDAAALLRKELSKPGYACQPIAVGINTDAYQPVERKLGITRQILEVLRECRHPFSLVTKSALVERDIDILADMARDNLVHVAISLTTLDRALARKLEPRAAAPGRRLETIARLCEASVPVGVLTAPLIPVLTDAEMETLLTRAREAGATFAGYVLLRLPHELKELFREWLETHAPTQATHVMNRLREACGGKDYDARFGSRMSGTGVYADLLAQRFDLACRKLGYGQPAPLAVHHFLPPRVDSTQMEMF